MKPLQILLLVFAIAGLAFSCKNQKAEKNESAVKAYQEPYRLQFHFSPAANWMNDPNGMVYYDGEYHLFYQYYPDSTVWGPMHWGHAVSGDLVHWQHLPIALYPDSLGYIFSGSAVMDLNNTSGLGEPGKPAMIAIFTYHNHKLSDQGRTDYQYQGMAYSLDKGRTWVKYKNNPVLPNPGLKDFRDPKVSWNSETGKWIMTLAVGDHIRFYSSPNLKDWKMESEFGKNMGAHGGVWECPDLFELPVTNNEGTKKWVLLVSINPGAPNGGSGTQYFIGSFDGHIFKWEESSVKWIDNGMDNYAGVTWSNVTNRSIFLGWMSNWAYAQVVPTHPWRSAMTVPRELSLIFRNNTYLLKSNPVKEMDQLATLLVSKENLILDQKGTDLKFEKKELTVSKIKLNVSIENAEELIIEISNSKNQKVSLGYKPGPGELYIDRTLAGRSDFEPTFAAKVHKLNIEQKLQKVSMEILIDKSSIEFFFDGGDYAMTDLVYPEADYNGLRIYAREGQAMINSLEVYSLESIWDGTPE
jgi:fructan beta-fructosidase